MLRSVWLMFLSTLLLKSLPRDDRDAAELTIAISDFLAAHLAKQENAKEQSAAREFARLSERAKRNRIG